MRLVMAAMLTLSSACVFTSISAESRLRDAVVGINDEARWNRLDLATQRVAPGYRARYRATHHGWHRSFEIADSEIIHVQVGEERETATSFVTVRWYDYASMVLAETTIRQKWQKVRGGFILTEEEVSEGNPLLLEIPEALQMESEDSDEEVASR